MDELTIEPVLDLPMEPVAPHLLDPNPCVKLYGPDPGGRKCKGCTRLAKREFSRVYWKCVLRKVTGGPGSDHRVGWNACARYTEEPPVCSVCGACRSEEIRVSYSDRDGKPYCLPCWQKSLEGANRKP